MYSINGLMAEDRLLKYQAERIKNFVLVGLRRGKVGEIKVTDSTTKVKESHIELIYDSGPQYGVPYTLVTDIYLGSMKERAILDSAIHTALQEFKKEKEEEQNAKATQAQSKRYK